MKMYKSPIDTLISDVVTAEENAVMRAVVKCGINVDKNELVKALAYDRGQYEKGYADAKAELIMTEQEAAKIVLEKLKEIPMFCGTYDARNGSEDWVYGAWAVMENIAYMISEDDGEAFNDMFSGNMVISKEKAMKPSKRLAKAVLEMERK